MAKATISPILPEKAATVSPQHGIARRVPGMGHGKFFLESWPTLVLALAGLYREQCEETPDVATEGDSMKRMIVGLVVMTLFGVNFLPGCSDAGKARVDVAKKKLLDQIDDALGKMDVQKAEIDNGIKSAKLAAGGIRKAKIKAQVSLDQLDEKVRPHQDKIAKCDETLAKLRDAIKADTPADFGGKTYTVIELKDMAGKVIQSRKECDDQVKGFETARQNMQNVVATISKQQQELEARITKLQAANSKLDAEMAAAKAMKQASATMGDGSTTLTENLDELERKLASLSADVRGELVGESEKWSPAGADKAINDVDAFIKSAQTPSDPVAEIDRILGPGK
jgi:phage shock protein A